MVSDNFPEFLCLCGTKQYQCTLIFYTHAHTHTINVPTFWSGKTFMKREYVVGACTNENTGIKSYGTAINGVIKSANVASGP